MLNVQTYRQQATPQAREIIELKTRVMDVLNAVIRLKAAMDDGDDTQTFRYAGEFSNTMRRYSEHVAGIAQASAAVNQAMSYIFGIDWAAELTEIDQAGPDFVALRDFIRDNRDAVTTSLSETDGNVYTIQPSAKAQLVPLVNAAFAHVEQ